MSQGQTNELAATVARIAGLDYLPDMDFCIRIGPEDVWAELVSPQCFAAVVAALPFDLVLKAERNKSRCDKWLESAGLTYTQWLLTPEGMTRFYEAVVAVDGEGNGK